MCVSSVHWWNFHLQFERNTGKRSDDSDAWMAYSAFHLGDYKRAMEVSSFVAYTF